MRVMVDKLLTDLPQEIVASATDRSPSSIFLLFTTPRCLDDCKVRVPRRVFCLVAKFRPTTWQRDPYRGVEKRGFARVRHQSKCESEGRNPAHSYSIICLSFSPLGTFLGGAVS